MSIAAQCPCGQRYSVKDDLAGFLAPPIVVAAEPPADRPAVSPSFTVQVDHRLGSPRIGREPWFYAFLGFYAGLTMVLGLVQAGAVTVLYFTAKPADSALVDGGTLMRSWGIGFTAVLVAAVVLLALDAARQLRAIRAAR